jgi:hypothetical protein
MKVYRQEKGSFNLFLCPNNDGMANGEWNDAEGKPKEILVTFKDGAAEVPNDLGRYLTDRKLALKTPLILPTQGGLVL